MKFHRPQFESIDSSLRPAILTLIEEHRDNAGNPAHKIDLSDEKRKRSYDWLDENGYIRGQERCVRRELGGDWQDLWEWLKERVDADREIGLADDT